MREIESRGVSSGVSRLVMMENAGSSIAREVMEIINRRLDDGVSVRAVFLAGTGNNGGDAFVAARHLSYWKAKGVTIELFLIGNEGDIMAEEALTNWKILKNLGEIIQIQIIDSEEKVSSLKEML